MITLYSWFASPLHPLTFYPMIHILFNFSTLMNYCSKILKALALLNHQVLQHLLALLLIIGGWTYLERKFDNRIYYSSKNGLGLIDPFEGKVGLISTFPDPNYNNFQYTCLMNMRINCLARQGGKAPRLPGNWFWWVGLVACKSLINSKDCCTVCSMTCN